MCKWRWGCLGEGLERAQLVQSPWGKRLPAKPEEQQGGHWGGRRGTGREEAEERRGGGRGGEMRPLVREAAAIWSEMEPREVSRDGKKQGSDSNQIPPWGPGRPLRGQGGQGGPNRRAGVSVRGWQTLGAMQMGRAGRAQKELRGASGVSYTLREGEEFGQEITQTRRGQ